MNDSLSDFLKIAYEHNRVKEIKEAFDEFPVEDEWHEGKAENVLKENKVEYKNHYEIGDIVFVREYFYEDGKNGNNHLFVIIDQNLTIVPIENFGMLISSNLKKINYKYNKLIEKNELNKLHKDSIIKTDVLYKITNEQIAFKIGKVDNDKIDEYKKCFYDSLNN